MYTMLLKRDGIVLASMVVEALLEYEYAFVDVLLLTVRIPAVAKESGLRIDVTLIVSKVFAVIAALGKTITKLLLVGLQVNTVAGESKLQVQLGYNSTLLGNATRSKSLASYGWLCFSTNW